MMACTAQTKAPQGFARRNPKRHRPHSGSDDVDDFKYGAVRCDFGLDEGIGHGAANKFLHEVTGSRLAHRHCGNAVAIAQHRDPIGDLEHLIEPVGDIDDADAPRVEGCFNWPQEIPENRCG